MISTPRVDWFALAPTLALLGASGVALLGAVLVPRWLSRGLAAFAAFSGFVAAGILAGFVFDRSEEERELLVQSMTRDRLGALASIIIAGAGALAVLVSWGERRRDHQGEYYALLAAAGGGMVFFVTASNLMTLFLGLEWFSIALYILCALDTHRETSLEAGLKYLVVGSFGSAILLFGSALVYGATGELGFSSIATSGGEDDYLRLAGLALIIAGLGFKASAAPFHMWTPDVYQGAPTSVTAFMSAATKVAALVLTLRILVVAFPDQEHLWTVAVAVVAVVSLAVGNLAALVQRDVKRLLAYSSISHAGFMLIAIAVNTELGARALLYYLIPYAAGSIGAFAVVAARERELGVPVTLERLGGLGWERPFLGVSMWIFMLGFMGLPLTGGFVGKFYVFSAAYEAGWWWLVLAGVAATAVSLYYYLNVVRVMYMRADDMRGSAELRPVVAGGSPPRDPLLVTAVAASVAVTVGSFVFVQPLIEWARDAAESLPF
ncbi:MAG: NADH-quinone oxidoreductase subunit N [Actinobacteria bacterium]|nr:NADH-quinone oxidoreductase subunit N [Actinomycetota bacterium]